MKHTEGKLVTVTMLESEYNRMIQVLDAASNVKSKTYPWMNKQSKDISDLLSRARSAYRVEHDDA